MGFSVTMLIGIAIAALGVGAALEIAHNQPDRKPYVVFAGVYAALAYFIGFGIGSLSLL